MPIVVWHWQSQVICTLPSKQAIMKFSSYWQRTSFGNGIIMKNLIIDTTSPTYYNIFSNFFEGLKKIFHYSDKKFSTKRKKIFKPMKNKIGRLQTAKIIYPFFPTPFASASMKPIPNEVRWPKGKATYLWTFVTWNRHEEI